jgi:hypothetical protein
MKAALFLVLLFVFLLLPFAFRVSGLPSPLG